MRFILLLLVMLIAGFLVLKRIKSAPTLPGEDKVETMLDLPDIAREKMKQMEQKQNKRIDDMLEME